MTCNYPCDFLRSLSYCLHVNLKIHWPSYVSNYPTQRCRTYRDEANFLFVLMELLPLFSCPTHLCNLTGRFLIYAHRAVQYLCLGIHIWLGTVQKAKVNKLEEKEKMKTKYYCGPDPTMTLCYLLFNNIFINVYYSLSINIKEQSSKLKCHFWYSLRLVS